MESIKKILIVDDEEDLVLMLQMRLQAAGFTIETAYNGKEGCEKSISFNPDVILLDLVMPVMDGWEACKQLKQNIKTRDIPIVLLTALSSKDLLQRAKKAMTHHVMLKPCPEEELVSYLKHLEKPQIPFG